MTMSYILINPLKVLPILYKSFIISCIIVLILDCKNFM